MKKITSFIVSFILAFTWAVPAFSATELVSRSVSVMKVEGDDITFTKGTDKSFKAKEGTKLSDGYTMATGKGCYAYLKLEDSSVIKLNVSTKVDISKTKGKELKLTVLSGDISVNAAKQKDGEKINIKAGNTIMGIRGTIFSVSYAGGKVEVNLFEGRLAIDMPSGATSLEQGNSIVVTNSPQIDGNAEAKVQPINLDTLNSFSLQTVLDNKAVLLEKGMIQPEQITKIETSIVQKQEQERKAIIEPPAIADLVVHPDGTSNQAPINNINTGSHSSGGSSSTTPTPTLTPIPTEIPTQVPTPIATPIPTMTPTEVPTLTPTTVPTPDPTAGPVVPETPAPTSPVEPIETDAPVPTIEPTAIPPPTPVPTATPSPTPTATPSPTPTATPSPTPTPHIVTTITVNGADTISRGSRATYSATVKDQDGVEMPGQTIVWSIDPVNNKPIQGITIDSTGVVIAQSTAAPGITEFTVRAEVNGVSGVLVTKFAEGGIGNPIAVEDVQGLKMVGYNAGAGGYYKLTKDIVITSLADFPIIGSESNPFVGVFDGNGKTITLMTDLDFSSKNNPSLHPDNVGLFGVVAGGTIKDLTLAGDKKIMGDYNVGSIAGTIKSGSVISNCTSTWSVEDTTLITMLGGIGGIVGYADADTSINNCVMKNATVRGSTNVGGIVGKAKDAHIMACASGGELYAGAYMGGIVGNMSGSDVSNCSSSSRLVLNGLWTTSGVGGIVGYLHDNTTLDSRISTCYFVGSMSPGTTNVLSQAGGIVGVAQGSADASRNTKITACMVLSDKIGLDTTTGLDTTVRFILGDDISAHGDEVDITACYVWNGAKIGTKIPTTVGDVYKHQGTAVDAKSLTSRSFWEQNQYQFGGAEANQMEWNNGFMPRVSSGDQTAWPLYLQ